MGVPIRSPRLQRNYACRALAWGCLAGAGALASTGGFAQGVVANGTSVDIPADTTINTGTTGNQTGYAINALNAGTVNAQGIVSLTTGGRNAIAVSAIQGSTINLEGGGSITTTGPSDSYGIWANASAVRAANFNIQTDSTSVLASNSGTVTVNNSSLRSTSRFGLHVVGNNAPGDVTAIHAADVDVTTQGTSAQAVEAYGYGTVRLDAVTRATSLSTAGSNSPGVLAQQFGVVQTSGVLNVSTLGDTAPALRATRSGQVVVGAAAGNSLTTSGVSSPGAHALLGGQITLAGNAPGDSFIETAGAGASGVQAQDAGSLVGITNMAVRTQGPQAHGVFAQTGGTVNVGTGQISVAGENANGAFAQSGAQVTIDGASTITTAGRNGVGVLAMTSDQPVVGDTTVNFTGAQGASVSTTGDFAHAIQACVVSTAGPTCGQPAASSTAPVGSRALVNVSGVNVATQGANSNGLYAWGSGSELTATNVTVNTSGAGSPAGVAINGGKLTVNDSKLATTGADATGVYLEAPAGMTSSATLNNTVLTAALSPSFQVGAGSAELAILNSQAVVNDGRWLQVGGNDPANPAIANVMVDPSVVTGAAITAPGSTSNVNIAAGSVWNLTGNSNITTLTNSESQILFSAPNGGAFKTLTAVNYTGQAGVLGLNSHLGGDGSPSDRLVIDGGTATGSTALRITNAGGPGALTPGNGIQVVSADNGATTANNAFALGSRVASGPYEYQLYRGAKDASDTQSWYLRSVRAVEPPAPAPAPIPPAPVPPAPPAPPVPVPPAPFPPGPPAPPAPAFPPEPPYPPAATPAPVEVPLYRPEVAAYLANQHQAATLFAHSLHDRLGEPQWTEVQRGNGAQAGDKRTSMWLRMVGATGNSDSRDNAFSGGTDTTLFQGGGDVARWAMGGDAGRLHLGGMLGYGEARTDASAAGNSARAWGKAEGWNLGAYATWYQNDADKLGWYADAWGSYGRFKNTVEADDMPSVKYDTNAWTLSGETGYAFKVLQDRDWVVEPQAQLLYVKADPDNVFDSTGTWIHGSDNSGWISRLGVRTHATWVSPNGNRAQPYLTLNWWHDTTDNSLTFNEVALSGLYPKDRYEVKLGVDAFITNDWTGWLNIGYQWGKQSFEMSTLRIGAKYTW